MFSVSSMLMPLLPLVAEALAAELEDDAAVLRFKGVTRFVHGRSRADDEASRRNYTSRAGRSRLLVTNVKRGAGHHAKATRRRITVRPACAKTARAFCKLQAVKVRGQLATVLATNTHRRNP